MFLVFLVLQLLDYELTSGILARGGRVRAVRLHLLVELPLA